jgi:hypothetical protein
MKQITPIEWAIVVEALDKYRDELIEESRDFDSHVKSPDYREACKVKASKIARIKHKLDSGPA